MKLILDTDNRSLTQEGKDGSRTVDLYTPEAFKLLSEQWVRLGWSQGHDYTFTWMGLPIIQLSEDMIRMQEVLYQVQPDVIVETGVAHGGSLVYYASLCKLFGRGRVIGVDVDIRPKNRVAIEQHPLASSITLVDGSSTEPDVVSRVRSLIRKDEKVLVILDSNHTKRHVLNELNAYHAMVSPGSYLVATDGIMRDLHDVPPRGKAEWVWDNPAAAAQEFVRSHPEFRLERPEWRFNESTLREHVTHWPDAWLKRIA